MLQVSSSVHSYSTNHRVSILSCDLFSCIHLITGYSTPSGSSPKVTISVDSAKEGNPFTTSHTPPLPQGSKVAVSAGNLSLESLLEGYVSVRSHAVLSRLKDTLRGTTWEKHGGY